MGKDIPVIKNQNYIIDITGQSHEGLGVGRIDNFTVFVKNAIAGERLKIKIVKVLKNYSYGKILEILKASTYRIEPKCAIANRCGGCQLQHISYEGQLKFKTLIVEDAISRIGGFQDIKVHNIIGMEDSWHYRNKAQIPVGTKNNEIKIGLFAERSHEIINTDICLIRHKINDEITKNIRKFINDYNISIYDETTGTGLIRYIMNKVGFKTGEVMVCIVINGEDLPYSDKLIEILRKNIKGLQTIVLNINKKRVNVALGKRNKIIYGHGYIYDYIGDFKFKISALSFYQVNPVQTIKLYEKALEYADLTGKEIVIDAYCGIGSISLFLSRKAKKVYGIEVVKEAITDAKENARLNDAENVEFILGESETVIPKLYQEGLRADVIVVDPPRKGCDEKLLETIAKMAPQRVVYVSCNPATLARDLKYLAERGYELKEVQPVDMFPWTGHIECVIGMQRKDM